MPVTMLDPHAALIVIDLQHGIERIFPRLCETGTSAGIIALLERGVAANAPTKSPTAAG